MAGVQQDLGGGIFGFLDLEYEVWEAITADLLVAGFTLADIPHRVDWLAIRSTIHQAREGSAVHQAKRRIAGRLPASGPRTEPGEHADWPEDRHLTVMLLDQLRRANWIAAYKGSEQPPPAPEPMWRPGLPVEPVIDGFKSTTDSSGRKTTQVGSDPIPARDFNRWWAATPEEREHWQWKEGK